MTEQLKIPKEVIESNWKDDVVDENDSESSNIDNIGLEYEPFKKEASFISPDDVKLPKDTEKAIARIKAKKIGITGLSLFEKTKPAA